LLNIAEVLPEAGKLSEAAAVNDTIAELLKTVDDVPPSTTLQTQRARAKLAIATGRWPEAVTLAQAAYSFSVSAFGEAHPDSAMTLVVLGTALEGAGQHAQALSRFDAFLSLAHKLSFDGNADSVRANVRSGESLLGLTRAAEAAARFEQALRSLERLEGNERLRAEARFGLARALVASAPRGERTRPVALAEQARTAALAQGRHAEADRISRWLAANR
jgi:Tetratricopeptide repeat